MTTTYTAAIGESLIAARRIGATWRQSAASAGISHATLARWIRKGRKGDPLYETFAGDYDAAKGVYEASLLARVSTAVASGDAVAQDKLGPEAAKAVVAAGRLALDVLKHRETKALRNAELKLAKARTLVEEHRAAGTHVERHEIATATDDALLEEARALAAALTAALGGSDPSTPH